MLLEDIRGKIEEAEMILVGLGEEFQCPESIKKMPEYEAGKEILQTVGMRWMLPAWDDYCGCKAKADTDVVLGRFAGMLAEKNYFVVSVAMNNVIAYAPWKEGRLVMPCGGSTKLQYTGENDYEPVPLSTEDSLLLKEVLDDLYNGKFDPGKLKKLGKRENVMESAVLNNIYAVNYSEKGYLKQWKLYTRWLQGTLNRNVLILELGVGMQFPTVIRFPFEKVAFFNQKAEFYRINEKLYHMTEELKGKGQGISQNAIDCLRNL